MPKILDDPSHDYSPFPPGDKAYRVIIQRQKYPCIWVIEEVVNLQMKISDSRKLGEFLRNGLKKFLKGRGYESQDSIFSRTDVR